MELDDELARTLNRSASAVRADAYLDEATERMRDSLRARTSPRRPGGGAPSPRSPTDGIAILLPRDDEGDGRSPRAGQGLFAPFHTSELVPM